MPDTQGVCSSIPETLAYHVSYSIQSVYMTEGMERVFLMSTCMIQSTGENHSKSA